MAGDMALAEIVILQCDISINHIWGLCKFERVAMKKPNIMSRQCNFCHGMVRK